MEKNPLVNHLNRVLPKLSPDDEITVVPVKLTPVARVGEFSGIAVNIVSLGRSTLFSEQGVRVTGDIVPPSITSEGIENDISSLLSKGNFEFERHPYHSELPFEYFRILPQTR